jgi:hypothetical protein
MQKETAMSAIRSLVGAAALLNVLVTAVVAEVTVEKDVPKRAKARFFERVQAGIWRMPLRTGGRRWMSSRASISCGCLETI